MRLATPAIILAAIASIFSLPLASAAGSPPARGEQFVPFTSFSTFRKAPGLEPGQVIWTSPKIQTRIYWNELIASWNADLPTNTWLKVEVRAFYPDHATKFYAMGLWSAAPSDHPSESIKHQKDADGNVLTDTLVLNQTADGLQVRVTLQNQSRRKPRLKFLGLSLLNTNETFNTLPPNRAAWDRMIPVPERSQMAYENGDKLCSPTTVSMLLAYWSQKLNRPQLDHDVPEVERGVFDPNWPGTGNWAFNMAYAGSFRGLRAYVTRMSDVSEIEDWIAQGIPVGLSVCYNRLRGKSRVPSGHIVVCCGFTKTGDPVINDPGTSHNVRKVFPRANLIDAWSYSLKTVYLVYPANARLPHDRFGHWDSSTARRFK